MALQCGISCPLCPVSFRKLSSVSEYTKHLRLFHATKPDFKITCGFNGCQRVYTNYGTFKNHLYGMHSGGIDNITDATLESEMPICSDLNSADDVPASETMSGDYDIDSDDDVNDLENSINGSDEMDSLCCPPDAMQKSSALFLLGLKEKHKLTQVTVQSIIDNVTTLTQQRMSSSKSQVRS